MQLRNGKTIVFVKKQKSECKNFIIRENQTESKSKSEPKSESAIKKTLRNLNKKLFEDLDNFYSIEDEYEKKRKSQKILPLTREEALIESSKLAEEVLENGNKIITSILCWFSSPDIFEGMKFYYSKNTMMIHIHVIKIIYILDKIRERYQGYNDKLYDKSQLFVKKCIELLKSFGFHILWTK